MTKQPQNAYRVGILGASGYTGADLVRILLEHPNTEIAMLSGERKAGQSISAVFPNFHGVNLPELVSLDTVNWQGVNLDAVFCALPHATSQEVIKSIVGAVGARTKVIDLSADFRLRDADTYAQWYGGQHTAQDIQKTAVYGLTEWYRESIKSASLVACPGCYPTAALLALLPLLKARAISPHDIIIDAKSGVSGAGRSLKEQNLFVEVAEAMHPYGLGAHRHMPEIEQELSLASGDDVTISFTPHLVPMNRGELETIYVRLVGGQSPQSLREQLLEAYESEAFVTVLPDGIAPATRMVRGSNKCVLNVFPDRNPDRAIVVAAIDNLVKGSSGQAIQNMNLMLGLPETTGLNQVPMFP